MKKIALSTLTFLCLLGLHGCAFAQQSRLNSGMQKAEAAMAECPMKSTPPKFSNAWETVARENAHKCPKSDPNAPLPASHAVEKNQCWVNLLNKHVRPVGKNAGDLDALIAESKKISQDYSDGKIEREATNKIIGDAIGQYMARNVSYYSYAQCRNAALQEHVLPSYPHKDILYSFMSEQSEIGLRVDKGEMSVEEADIATQKAFASLLGAEKQANTVTQQQNAKAWQQGFENLKKLEQSNTRSMPRQTNCNVFGNTMNCTSW